MKLSHASFPAVLLSFLLGVSTHADDMKLLDLSQVDRDTVRRLHSVRQLTDSERVHRTESVSKQKPSIDLQQGGNQLLELLNSTEGGILSPRTFSLAAAGDQDEWAVVEFARDSQFNLYHVGAVSLTDDSDHIRLTVNPDSGDVAGTILKNGRYNRILASNGLKTTTAV